MPKANHFFAERIWIASHFFPQSHTAAHCNKWRQKRTAWPKCGQSISDFAQLFRFSSDINVRNGGDSWKSEGAQGSSSPWHKPWRCLTQLRGPKKAMRSLPVKSKIGSECWLPTDMFLLIAHEYQPLDGSWIERLPTSAKCLETKSMRVGLSVLSSSFSNSASTTSGSFFSGMSTNCFESCWGGVMSVVMCEILWATLSVLQSHCRICRWVARWGEVGCHAWTWSALSDTPHVATEELLVLDLLDTNCNCPGRGELSARPEKNTIPFWLDTGHHKTEPAASQITNNDIIDNRYEDIWQTCSIVLLYHAVSPVS